MKLDSIRVEGFKRIAEIDLPLSDLNILVGSNGSGKSSILQAIHLASCLLRQADRIRSGSTTMVRVSDLDYLPSDEYWRLGHGADWGNKATSPFSKVLFKFKPDDDPNAIGELPLDDDEIDDIEAECLMRAARNAGISVQGELPESVRNQFRGAEAFFSGFIPGISGIPNVEQKNSRRVVLKACSFGDSNVYLRNALDLLSRDQLDQIQEWLEPLLGEIKLHVNFDERRDLEIHADAEVEGKKVPLELMGTGYLQLIQIFCYILLFKPKILLIDEPDIHLHPIVQEKLTGTLLSIARDQSLKIVMTTHSPFIVRGAPLGTNVTWLSEGEKKSDDRTVVELALGWGAFGKKIIIASEDAKNDHLKKLISQWPDIERSVAVLPGRGFKHLLTKDEASELRKSLGNKFKILVHRDRDSLTDAEVQSIKDDYADDGIRLWVTDQSDIEAEFCGAPFLAALTGRDEQECRSWVDEILVQHSAPIGEQFAAQRTAHNRELHAAGGSPTNDEVWAAMQSRPLRGGKGKFIYGQLKNKAPDSLFSEAKVLGASEFPEICGSLKANLEDLLA